MRILTALVVGLVLALGTAGCGSGNSGDGDGVATAGDGSAGGAGSEASAGSGPAGRREQALRHAQCMRENGVPDYPDPKFDDNGGESLDLPDGISKESVDKAAQACRQFEPNGGEPTKLDPQRLDQLRAYAKCMRENGLGDFPDPTDQGIQVDGNNSTLDPNSEAYKKADAVCAHLAPAPAEGEGPGLSTGG